MSVLYDKSLNESVQKVKWTMVAAPLILGGGAKILDQNNWGGGPEQKIKLREELNLKGDLKF